MIIGKTFHFDAAHWLPGHAGKCKDMHGHTWKVTVELEGEIDPTTHMVMDFNVLKAVMDDVLDVVDHKVINELLTHPTCEELVQWMYNWLGSPFTNVHVHSIQIQEGEGGYARKEVKHER